MNIAIVGATGNVGRKIIEVLEKKKFPITELFLIASSKSEGKKINFNCKELIVNDLEKFDFSKVKIAFFAAGSTIAEKWAIIAAEKTIVIDNSKFFRKDPDIPLVVPEVNSKELAQVKNKNIIANANCSVIPVVVALKPLHDLYDVKRIVVSTYQSVSGAGKAPMDELIEQTKQVLAGQDVKSKNFTKQIAFNAIPHIDVFSDDGYTKEELKMTNETKKILDNKIDLTATCVRLPISISHAESVNIQFEKKFSIKDIIEALNKFEGCQVIDDRSDGGYITPLEAEGKNETFISRIREDKTIENGLNLWIVSDNLLRGAALNAVEIAETLIKNNFYGK